MEDIHFFEEIETGSPNLQAKGLILLEVSGEYVAYASSLPSIYGNKPSSSDYLALALAKEKSCPLLTGDAELKEIAKKEQIQVNGTIWLLCTMIEHGIITKMDARTALKLMEEAGRGLFLR